MSHTTRPARSPFLTALLSLSLAACATTGIGGADEEAASYSAPPEPSSAPASVIAEVASAGSSADASGAPAQEYLDIAEAEPAARSDRDAAPLEEAAMGATASRTRQPLRREAKKSRASAVSGASTVMDGVAYAPLPSTPAPDDAYHPYTANTERYTHHGVNPFTSVLDDPLSTFSVDVDTASYTIARRKLQEGTLPPQAAVRVEEFVNFFDYHYRSPNDDAFAVHMDAMPDPFRPNHHIFRVGVQGKEISRHERQPLHLTFLVDVSGSMSSADKLPLAQDSLHLLVDRLREDDTVALCTYAGRVARILEPTSAASAHRIHDAIDSLNSGGSTAMSAGIDLAYEMAWESFQPGHENRVVILSDGDANVGSTSWDAMLSQIKGYADRGVTVSTIGFGMGNYQDTLMEQLSNNGDGNNYYVDGREQAERIFVEQIGGTLVTIARDTKIQVEFNPESVSAYRLIGYENRDIADKDFRNDRVDAGEVGSGHSVTALYEVVLRSGYDRRLATVRMRWEKPGPDGVATERAFSFEHDALAETPWLASRSLRIAYASSVFSEILRGSPHAAEVSLGDLARFTRKALRNGEDDDRELLSLIQTADRLDGGTGIAVR